MSKLGRLPNMNRGSPSNHWWKLVPALAIGAAISAGIVTFVVFWENDHDEPSAVQPGDAASAMNAANVLNEGAGGEGPKWIWPPKRVTEGDWVPSVASVKVTEERPTPAPQHVGEVINGVRILALSEGAGQGPCPGQQKPAADMALPFEAGYLPPNTFEIAEPEVVVCPDGAIVYAGRMFEIGVGVGAAFNIDYVWSGLAAAAGTGEVRPITVNGHPGVAIAPEMYEGAEIGPGAVVLVTEHAAIEVYGSSMPLAELIKIAEGVKCSDC